MKHTSTFDICSCFTWLGVLVFFYHLFKFLHSILWTHIRGPINLLQRYGKGSYAVVTGSTDGIGLEFARELARQGFNIVLMARKAEKLQKVEEELKNINSAIDVVKIAKDCKDATQSGYFDDIKKTLSNLDISLLVNNVAFTKWAAFKDTEEKDIGDTIIVNTYFPTMLTRILLPQMLARKNTGGIISVSSYDGLIPFGYFTTYSATKFFNDGWAQALRQEIGDKLDVLSLCPGQVKTKGSRSENESVSFIISSPEDTACSALKDLGIQRRTFGSWKHKVAGYFIAFLMPQRPMSYFATLETKRRVKKHLAGRKSD